MANSKITFKSSSKRKRTSIASRDSIIKKNKDKYSSSSRSKRSSIRAMLRRSNRFRNIKKVLIISAAVIFIICSAVVIYLLSWIQSLNDELPSLDEPFKDQPIATVILDRKALVENEDGNLNTDNGTQLYKVFDKYNSDPVDINEIPAIVRWAFLAAEDIKFYDHGGYSTKGIIRCAYKNVFSGGSTVCGGSTITQQLLKITTLGTEENAYKRKIKEILMATKVESKYTKDEILQMYLSVVPFGSNIVGIETASKFYFNVEPKDLTLAQATILASIIQDPSYLSPTQPVDGDLNAAKARVKERQEYVLDQMSEYMNYINNRNKKNVDNDDAPDLISEEILRLAQAEELNYAPGIATDKKAGHFVDYVLEALTTDNYKNGEEPFTLSELQTGGYKIITSLDYEQQVIAEAYVAKGGNDYPYWNVSNAAVMTIDPSNGQILTMAGSKNYYGDSEGCNAEGIECKYDPQVNVLTSLNEPGSTAKALGYTLAFEQGKLFGGSNLPDVPIDYPEINYFPKNWDGTFLGHILSVRVALQQSRNIPALEVLEVVGLDNYYNQAVKMGYTTFDRNQLGPSVILGGASVKYTEHIAAFTAYANEGKYVALNPIVKILDRKGNVIYEADVKEKEVFSPQAVYMLDDILYNLQSIGDEAGVYLISKTGTTEGNTEALQVAWNNNQVTLAWVGNNNNDPIDAWYGYPIFVVQPWMASYIAEISALPYYQGKDAALKIPGFLYKAGGGCEGDNCMGVGYDWLIEGKNPPGNVITEKAMVCIDQDKLAREVDIASGNAVEKVYKKYIMPAARWQKNLDQYLKDKGIQNGAPTEMCDASRGGDGYNSPLFQFTTPTDSMVLNNNTLNVQGSVISVGPSITEVRFYLDGNLLGTVEDDFSDINKTYSINSLGLSDGYYIFSVEATVITGSVSTYDIPVIVGSADASLISFVSVPPASLVYGDTIGPSKAYNIKVAYSGGIISSAQLYQMNSKGQSILVGTMNPVEGGFEINWGNSVPNENETYTFYVIGKLGNSGSLKSNQSSPVTVSKAKEEAPAE